MNAQADQALIEKLKTLPPQRRAEVEDFVDFLASRERRQAVQDFLAVGEKVAQAGIAPLSSEEIEAEITALRAERRARAARP